VTQVPFVSSVGETGPLFQALSRSFSDDASEGSHCRRQDRHSTRIENFPRLLDVGRKAGIEHALVEYDQPVSPVDEVQAAYQYLMTLNRKAV
jgi:hypothetical protein